ncbi:MAG TPA: methyltransferase domain-containing protein [Chloroflexia bacterium]|nr:methyltransferase domain-containing protein [Chloroflexia bacterium]
MKDYKQIWNNLSASFPEASYHVCCVEDEEEIRSNGQLTAAFLREVLEIGPGDRVLEIGCGVARIGRELAPYCGEWHGADISGNMIAYATKRTEGMPNVHLYEQPDNTLSIFPDNYFDCVYCTIVFMHVDKLEMFTYLRESFRLLKPGGRAYFDTYNILAPQAWEEFRRIIDTYAPHKRPGHVSQFSTPQEMQKFMEEAGFESVFIDGESNKQLLVALGRKPQVTAEATGEVPAGIAPTALPQSTGERAIPDEPPETSDNESATQLRAEIDRLNKALRGKEAATHELQAMMYGKNRYIEEVEAALDVKNKHIARLERIVQHQEKLLHALPVRVALRLRRTLRLP